ncbi:protein tyrosine/serine phosphatase [Caballeronia temeraria]|uniref:Protein tyrosine/serine phosphatase n=1 Tax=Caballeronia temeraria TaxID=1777137 RepID=A0A158CKU3_9BURK|nr:tyrosine-protein phosphatase [Caballeronia temeraria]SAK82922.1 protein tyrosine/serine phosphatase [Caballeronia temeraria]
MMPASSLCPAPLSRRAFIRGGARVALLSTTFGASALLSACGGAGEDQSVAQTPRLASVENFRDVAGVGEGYPTVDGGRLRRGVFYRSGALTPDDADAAILGRLSLRAVHDLRVVAEASLAPDRVPSDAVRETHEIAPIDVSTAMPADASAANAWMSARQRQLVTDPAARLQFGLLLTRLARVPGAQVIHGTAGKDRTGWAAALMLSIADVPLDVIIQDYLLTNTAAQSQIDARMKAHAARPATNEQSVAPLYRAQSATIEAAFEEMHRQFGTLNNYLAQGLSMSTADVVMLRAKLVA